MMHGEPSASPLPTQNEAEGTKAGELSQSHPHDVDTHSNPTSSTGARLTASHKTQW